MLNNRLSYFMEKIQGIKSRPAARNYCLLTMMLILLLVTELDLWLLSIWAEGELAFLLVLLPHFLASSLFLLHTVFCRLLDQGWGFSALTFLMVLVLGPLGAAGMVMSALFYIMYRSTATPFEIWYKEILPEQTTTPEEMLIERLRAWSQETEQQHRELVPFTDVLISGSISEKETAIDLMVRNYHPIFAHALRAALADSCNAVRAHAVAAITKIEEVFLAETLLLERLKNKHPNDFENLLALARHYDNHANAGLGDSASQIEYRHKAEALYRHLQELRPDDESIDWALGRLLVRDNRISEASDIFEGALKKSGGVVDPLQRIWHWECLYNLQRLTNLREEIRHHQRQIPAGSDLPQSLLDSIELWRNDKIDAEAITE